MGKGEFRARTLIKSYWDGSHPVPWKTSVGFGSGHDWSLLYITVIDALHCNYKTCHPSGVWVISLLFYFSRNDWSFIFIGLSTAGLWKGQYWLSKSCRQCASLIYINMSSFYEMTDFSGKRERRWYSCELSDENFN